MFDFLVGSFLQLIIASKSADLVTPLPQVKVLSEHQFSLENRYNDSFVNGVFKDNILLTLAYMRERVPKDKKINWEEVEKPFSFEIMVKPQEIISYHGTIIPKYHDAKPLTTVYFNGLEGFKSDGYLIGDGTCHLASLLGWVARDAGLSVDAPTNHNFAVIPDVPKEQGVAIYNHPNFQDTSGHQNLYIQNTKEKAVTFSFAYTGETLRIQATEKQK